MMIFKFISVLAKLIKTIGKLLAGFLGVIGLVFLGVFALIQTPWVRDYGINALEQAAQAQGYTLKIQHITGVLPFHWGIDQVHLGDAQGPLFSLSQLRFDVSASALLWAEVKVSELSAHTVRLYRLPASSNEDEVQPTEAMTVLPSLDVQRLIRPHIPAYIPSVLVEQLSIAQIDVDKAVFGHALNLTLQANMAANSERINIHTTLTQGASNQAISPTLDVRFDSTIDLLKQSMAVTLAVQDQQLAAKLLQQEDLKGLNMQLSLQGPWHKTHGRLTLQIPRLGKTETTVWLTLEQQFGVAVNAKFWLSKHVLLPPGFPAVVTEQPFVVAFALTQQDEQHLHLADFHLTHPVAAIRANVQTNVIDQQFDGNIQLTLPQLSQWTGLLNKPVQGDLQFSVVAKGPFLQPQGRFTVQGQQLVFDTLKLQKMAQTIQFSVSDASNLAVDTRVEGQLSGVSIAPLTQETISWDGRLTLQNQRVNLHHVSLKALNTTTDVSGVWQLPTQAGQLEVNIHAAQLHDLIKRFAPDVLPEEQALSAEAMIHAKTSIQPNMASIQVALTTRLESIQVPPEYASIVGPWVNLDTSLTLVPEQSLTLDHLVLTSAADQIHLNADVVLDLQDFKATGDITGGIDALASVARLSPQAFDGRLNFSSHFAREHNQQTINSVIQLHNLTGEFGHVKQITLNSQIHDANTNIQAWAPKHVQLDTHLVMLDVQGAGVALQQANIQLSGTPVALEVTAALKGALQSASAAPQSFDVKTSVQLQQTPEAMQIQWRELSGTLAKRALSLKKPLRIVLGKAHVETSEIELSWADAALNSQPLWLSEDQLKGELAIHLPLSLLKVFSGPALAGAFSTQITLTGSGRTPTINAVSEVAQLSLPNMPADLAKLPIHIKHQMQIDGGLMKQAFSIQHLADKPFTATLALPFPFALQPFHWQLDPAASLTGEVDGTIDLHRIEPFLLLEEQTFAGLLSLQAQITGSLQQPDWTANVSLKEGKIENASTGTLLHDIALTVQASPAQVTLSTLSMNDGGDGRIQGHGVVQLDQPNLPYDMTLEMAQATLVRRDDVTATISGKTHVSGDSTAVLITSQLVMNRVDVGIPNPGVSYKTLTVIKVDAQGRPLLDPAKSMDADTAEHFQANLDIEVSIPSKLFIKGRGLDSEWEGNIQVTGDASDPDIVGYMRQRRGYLDILDRRFIIREGRLDFTGNKPPIPTILLDTAVKTRSALAIIKVTGMATDPVLSLSSEPALPKDEIMAQILFDRSTAEISPIQLLSLAASLNTLRGGGGTSLTEKVNKKLGIDNLDVSTEDITAGKYITDKVYVKLKKDFKRGNEVTVEYELTPNVTIDAKTDEKANTGIGLQWRKDY